MHAHLRKQIQLVAQATECLVLSDQQLAQIGQTFSHELRCALDGNSANSLQVFPTFIDQVPGGNEHGHYLALDLGGTNFRVLLISLEGNRQSSVVNRCYSISQELMRGHGEVLFDYIALCVFNFVKDHGLLGRNLKLGFTFSFPCKQSSRKQAVLTKWTKGFSCSGVVNKDIGEMLKRSIAKFDGLQIEVAAIVNDTTGTLISCAYQEPDCRMGVIIGTGVNICYMESKCRDTEMIINTELGAFGSGNRSLDFIRTDWDKQVDECTINSGQQLFEKLVSGMYLGEIVRIIVVDLICRGILDANVFGSFRKRDSFTTALISRVELDAIDSEFANTQDVFRQSMSISNATLADCASLHLICSRVSRRSAQLTSAVIAALLKRMDRRQTVIGVDGSVYRCHPHYKTVINEKVAQLLPLMGANCVHFRLMLSEDGSGRGAALVAALPTDQIESEWRCTRCKEASRLQPGQIGCRLCAVSV